MSKFVEFLGGAFLKGKDVAVYRDGEDFALCAETTGGKKISQTARMTASELEDLRGSVFAGDVRKGDAEATKRALDYMLQHHPLPA